LDWVVKEVETDRGAEEMVWEEAAMGWVKEVERAERDRLCRSMFPRKKRCLPNAP
jgi:hypothetical protein